MALSRLIDILVDILLSFATLSLFYSKLPITVRIDKYRLTLNIDRFIEAVKRAEQIEIYFALIGNCHFISQLIMPQLTNLQI